MINKLLKQNSLPMGILLGIILPPILFALLFGVDILVFKLWQGHLTSSIHLLILLSTAANLYPLRYYLINIKLEKTGMGLLIITTVEILGYFYIYFNQ